MHRLGALLMIIGANLVVGSIAVGFYLAALGCAMGAPAGDCEQGPLELFFGMMSSAEGLIVWMVVLAGGLVFWKGRKMRQRHDRTMKSTS
jgi:heme/copper-type cytochrome/quinol oxidase subunit 2